MKVKEESEKVGLKLNILKIKIMASSPITSRQIGKQWEQWQTLFSWAPKLLQMVTAAMKLKDPGKPNLPLGLRGKAGGGARVTAGP